MRIIFNSPTAIHIALSRTNLETLQRLLDLGAERTEATIQKPFEIGGIGVDLIGNLGIIVTAEEDEAHYKGATPGPAAKSGL